MSKDSTKIQPTSITRPWFEKFWFSPCYIISELVKTVQTRNRKNSKMAENFRKSN